MLGAIGFALAVGRYDINGYLWVEGIFIVGTVVLGFVFFSSWARRQLVRFVPLARRLRIERPARAVYEGVHAYRKDGRLLVWLAVVTLGVQVIRILPIWLCARGGRDRPLACARSTSWARCSSSSCSSRSRSTGSPCARPSS